MNRLASILIPLALSTTAAASPQILYSSDFESDDGGLVVTSGSDWEHGEPTSGPGAAHSGLRCWGTVLDGSSTSSSSDLELPAFDTSAAAGASGLLVSWWQFFDETHPFPSFNAYVSARGSGAAFQTVFGRRPETSELPYTGWRQVAIVLGPEYASTGFTLYFDYDGSTNTDGWYLDDLTIEVLRAVTLRSQDFEATPGEFESEGFWMWGVPDPSCLPPPFWFASPSSGTKAWGMGMGLCGYAPFRDDDLTSPVIDLSPWANRREVYLSWNRIFDMEIIGDGVHHQVSFDGGTSWQVSAGAHHSGSSSQSSMLTRFGLRVDPSVTPDVRLRWRLQSDIIEQGGGMWLDDLEVAVPETVLGTGANPFGSLEVASGAFELGSPVQLAIDDPGATFTPGSVGFLSIALQPDANLPGGTPIAGWGMSAPGASGDYLLDASSVVFTKLGSGWSPGSPSHVNLSIPNDPVLVDLELWLQAALIDPAAPGVRVGLTTGLFERLSP